MAASRFTLPPPAAPERPRARRIGDFFLRSWIGRVVLAAMAVTTAATAGLPLPDALTGPAWLVTVIFVGYSVVRFLRWFSRRLLWRIRTKMLLSYLFIAVVPVVLLTLFFVIGAFLGLSLVASHVVASHVDRVARELQASARATLAGLRSGDEHPSAAVASRLAPLKGEYPGLGFVLFRKGQPAAAEGEGPRTLPVWAAAGFTGLAREGEGQWVRAVAAQDGNTLVVQVPVDESLFAGLRDRSGVRVLTVGGRVEHDEKGVRVRGDERKKKGVTVTVGDDDPDPDFEIAGSRRISLPGPPEPWGLNSGALVEQRRWEDGKQELQPMAIRFHPPTLLKRLSPGTLDLGDIFVKVLLALAGSFVVLYIAPLALGLLLARSITRSVHELSRGTVHLRVGDFRHQIPVRSRDQLGELAESFNVMARGIEDLLREQAEKQRMEEELRIARQIQMSLLPAGDVSLPGIQVAAACLPAAEVGGDYYDLLPLSPHLLGVLVADVSGKGTSAALYMAELKGLILSLSRIYQSPVRLLSEANRILAATMDVRSFITMTYAVVDTEARLIRFARAGHNPLLRLHATDGTTELLAPPGLGLGMDRGERFDALLQEVELPLLSGDVYLFFTDGLSEAMNSEGDLFGDERLASVLRRTASLDGSSPELVRDEVLREVKRFAGDAPQHDDMTMVVLKVV